MGLGALAVLAFVFASLLALVPLAIAAVSILSTFLVVLLLTYFTDVSFIVQFLVALVSSSGDRLACSSSPDGERSMNVGPTTTPDHQSRRDGRPHRHSVWRHGGDQPACADCDPGAGPAQCRHRRHSHSARLDRRRADVVAAILGGLGRASTGPESGTRKKRAATWSAWARLDRAPSLGRRRCSRLLLAFAIAPIQPQGGPTLSGAGEDPDRAGRVRPD